MKVRRLYVDATVNLGIPNVKSVCFRSFLMYFTILTMSSIKPRTEQASASPVTFFLGQYPPAVQVVDE